MTMHSRDQKGDCILVGVEWKKKYGRKEENNEARYVQFHIPVINSKSLSNEMRSYTNSLLFHPGAIERT